MSSVSRSRFSARVVLHGVARAHFKYPPLEDNAWYLPEVIRWEKWLPAVPPKNRQARRLIGSLILPSYVRFHVPPHVHVKREDMTAFILHLQQRTGSKWDVSDDSLPEGFITAERLSQEIKYQNPSEPGTTHTLALPASPEAKRMRLAGSLVRGLLKDEWSRERTDDDGQTRYPSGNGT